MIQAAKQKLTEIQQQRNALAARLCELNKILLEMTGIANHEEAIAHIDSIVEVRNCEYQIGLGPRSQALISALKLFISHSFNIVDAVMLKNEREQLTERLTLMNEEIKHLEYMITYIESM